MEKKTITIKSVSQKEGRYSICSYDNIWYSSFGTCPVKKADKVDLEYELNGDFKNIINLKLVQPGIIQADKFKPSFSEMPNEKAITMLVSYCKDIVVAQLDTKDGKAEVSIRDLDNLFKDANENVWNSYEFFKNKIKGEPNEYTD